MQFHPQLSSATALVSVVCCKLQERKLPRVTALLDFKQSTSIPTFCSANRLREHERTDRCYCCFAHFQICSHALGFEEKGANV